MAIALAVDLGGASGPVSAHPTPDRRPPSGTVRLIVEEAVVRSHQAEALVLAMGGTIDARLPIIDGFAATIPADGLEQLSRSPVVAASWQDGSVRLEGLDDDDDGGGDDDDDDLTIAEYDLMAPNTAWRQAIGLDRVEDRYDGEDVTVAVIDTGVAQAADLEDAVEARVDLTADRDGEDRYGHGTHMTGIVAGDGTASSGRWRGVAPGTDIVSIKVAGWDGATDVSVVIAALQWAVTHREAYDIRVLNLSFGTDGNQAFDLDPLDRAVERAWQAGILVVTSAGNRGPANGTISKPADDPHVLTVGASDVNGTNTTQDDVVAPFSSRGPTQDGLIKPDLVAPGITVVASRASGSTIDTFRPEARIDGAYLKGSGTSQAAAVVSGIAALLFQADPALTPDLAKAILMGTAHPLPGQDGAGAGQVDAAAALAALQPGAPPLPPADPGAIPAGGGGSIDASRGSHKVFADIDGNGVPEMISGEVDALGEDFHGPSWATAPWTAAEWSRSPWARVTCVSEAWSPPVCGDRTWTGMSWDDQWWGYRTWSLAGWDQKSWTNKSWTQKSWTAGHWN